MLSRKKGKKDEIFKMVCGFSFKINGSQHILNFGEIAVLKIALHNKIDNKTWTKKYEEKSAHSFRQLSENLPRKLPAWLDYSLNSWSS